MPLSMGRERLNELIKAKNRHQKKALAITAALAAAGSKQGTMWFKIRVTHSTIPTEHPISRPWLRKFRSSFCRATAFVLAGLLLESWATEQARWLLMLDHLLEVDQLPSGLRAQGSSRFRTEVPKDDANSKGMVSFVA